MPSFGRRPQQFFPQNANLVAVGDAANPALAAVLIDQHDLGDLLALLVQEDEGFTPPARDNEHVDSFRGNWGRPVTPV